MDGGKKVKRVAKKASKAKPVARKAAKPAAKKASKRKSSSKGKLVLRGGASDLYLKTPVIELKLISDYIAQDKNPGNFELELINERIRKSNQALINVYSPGCPHCVDFKDTYVSMASKINNKIPVAAINADDVINGNEILADYMNIKSYPTVLWYDKGEYTLYDGKREMSDLMRYVCAKSGKCFPGYEVFPGTDTKTKLRVGF